GKAVMIEVKDVLVSSAQISTISGAFQTPRRSTRIVADSRHSATARDPETHPYREASERPDESKRTPSGELHPPVRHGAPPRERVAGPRVLSKGSWRPPDGGPTYTNCRQGPPCVRPSFAVPSRKGDGPTNTVAETPRFG